MGDAASRRYCARLGIGLGAVKFLLRGERVYGASTPAELKVHPAGCGKAIGSVCSLVGLPLRHLLTAQVCRCAGCSQQVPGALPFSDAIRLPPPVLQMKVGDELTAVPEGSDSRRQMAELGPLFATVFGSKAAAAAGAGAKPELL